MSFSTAPLETAEVKSEDAKSVVDALAKVLTDADKSDHEYKKKWLDCITANPDVFISNSYDLTLEQCRAQTIKELHCLSKNGMLRAQEVVDAPMRYFAAAEMANLYNPSLAVKLGAHLTLFAGAIYGLGSKRHMQFVHDANDMKIGGCFGLTELGHGSNARGIETTATYDKAKDEFIIHSPTVMAQKIFIGGSVNGDYSVVFAQMYIDGVHHGVQAFIVPLRDAQRNVLPTVRIADQGHKLGLWGVDNGRMMFNQHRIPRENLLDKFGTVTAEGKYVTEIKSNGARFATMIGSLIFGRIGLTFASISVAKLGLLIGIKYSAERLQFGPPGKPEIPILDYTSQQRRLFIPLAKTYALHFASRRILEGIKAQDQKKLHILAAGLKAVSTWHVNETLALVRQCCGGQGYISNNRIGELKNGVEIYTTFEGDNTVLLQQVAASLLSEFKEHFKQISSMVSFVADNVAVKLKEANPAKKRYASHEHLLSTSFQMDALRFRKARAVQNLAGHLRSASKTKPFFEAWNECLPSAIPAALAHIDYSIFKSFHTFLASSLNVISGEAASTEATALFRQIKDLYALSIISDNTSFYLEEGYIAPSKAKAIHRQVNELCRSLRPHAVTLVEAFNIPSVFIPPLGKSSWVEAHIM